MQSLIKQIRVRFSDVGQANPTAPTSFKDRRIPLQKTQSFKGEKKRSQNWFGRQLSRQMSGDFDPNTQMERATAVAASAYAIRKSLEESGTQVQRKASGFPPHPTLIGVNSNKEDALITNVSEQKRTSDGLEPSTSRQKSKKEDVPIPIADPGRVSKRFSGEKAAARLVSPDREVPVAAAKDEKVPERAIAPPPTTKRSLTFEDELLKKSPDTAKPKRTPSKVTDPSPSSIKKTPTVSDDVLNRSSSKKPEGDVQKSDLPPTGPGMRQSKPDIPQPVEPPAPPIETIRHSSVRPGTTETHADVWEEAQMAKIKEKYEKLNETIFSWEEKKRKKARRKLDNTESELEKKRVKALQKFRSDMETIDQIAGGARAQAEEKRRNEELKAKEKANIIRTTGKVPATACLCF